MTGISPTSMHAGNYGPVTDVEPALLAWEDYETNPVICADLRVRPPMSDRGPTLFTVVRCRVF